MTDNLYSKINGYDTSYYTNDLFQWGRGKNIILVQLNAFNLPDNITI